MTEESSQREEELEVEEKNAPPAATVEEESEDSYKDKYFRILAELENQRKRLQREKIESIKFVLADTVLDFLQPLDNFETALFYAENSSPEVKQWAVGFEMIVSQFKEALAKHGFESFESLGKMFHPGEHEAVEVVEDATQEEGLIVKELQKGWKTKDRVVRPARVHVVKHPKAAPVEQQEPIQEA